MYPEVTSQKQGIDYSQNPKASKRNEKEDKLRSFMLDLLPVAGGVVGSVGGSFIAPGVGTIGGGAAGSALGEALRQRLAGESVNAKKIATEGALGLAGGVAGEALGATARVGGKILTRNLPKWMMSSVLKESPTAARASVKAGTSLAEEALDRGMVGLSKERIYQGAISKVANLEDGLQSILKGSKQVVNLDEVGKVTEPLIKKYTEAGNTAAVKNITDRLAALKAAHPNGIPVEVANQVKRTLYDEVRNGYGQLASESKEGIKAIARGIKEEIANRVPEVIPINKDLSYFGRVADALEKRIAAQSGKAAIGLKDLIIGGGGLATAGPAGLIPLALVKAGESTAVKTAGAQALKKVGDVGARVVESAAMPVIKSLTGQAASRGVAAVTGVGDGGGGGGGGAGGEEALPELPTQDTTDKVVESPKVEEKMGKDGYLYTSDGRVYSADKQWQWDGKQNDWVKNPDYNPMSEEFLRQKYIEAAQKGDKATMALAKEAYSFLYPKAAGKKLTAGQLKEMSDLENSANLIDGLNGYIDNNSELMGPIKGRVGTANPYNTEAQGFNSKMLAVAQNVGKAMEGGKITAEDVDKYRRMLPQITDTPAVAKQKVKQVSEMLSNQLKTKTEIYSAFDVAPTTGIDDTNYMPNYE